MKKVFSDAFFFGFFPALVLGLMLVLYALGAGIWLEIIAIFVFGVVAIYSANAKWIDKKIALSQIILRDVLVLGTVIFVLLTIADRYNTHANSVQLSGAFFLGCLGLIGIIVLFGDMGNFISYDKDLRRPAAYSGVSKLVAILVAICGVYMLWRNFGTQFIWLPVIPFACLSFCLEEDPVIKKTVDRSDVAFWILFIAGFAPAAVAIVSTLYQFWFSPILWNFVFWQVLLALVLLALAIVAIFFGIRKYNQYVDQKNQRAKEEAYKKEQKRLQQEEADAHLKEINTLIQNLVLSKNPTWCEIAVIARYYSFNAQKFLELKPAIFKAPLNGALSVSVMKKQIFWSPVFQHALQVIQNIAELTHDDTDLDALTAQMKTFLEGMKAYDSFAGYGVMIEQIKARCPIIYRFATEKPVNEKAE